jgi:hypothetical protein
MTAGAVPPKLKLGICIAPAGLEAIVALRATLPTRPPAGVTVIVEVFPVVAPGVIATAVPLKEKPGIGAMT